MQPSSTQQLDIILTLLNSDINDYMPYTDLRKQISEETIPNKELGLILNKLSNDGYVSTYDIETYGDALYSITLEGRLFLQQSGYTQEIIRNNAKNTRLEKIEKLTRANQRFQIWLSFLIALGTLIAAFYYARELGWI